MRRLPPLAHGSLHCHACPRLPVPQGRWPLFDDLAALDGEVYRSLVSLKRYTGDVADLTLDFTGAPPADNAPLGGNVAWLPLWAGARGRLMAGMPP